MKGNKRGIKWEEVNYRKEKDIKVKEGKKGEIIWKKRTRGKKNRDDDERDLFDRRLCGPISM